jgi:hypothetical protein
MHDGHERPLDDPRIHGNFRLRGCHSSRESVARAAIGIDSDDRIAGKEIGGRPTDSVP